MGGNFSKKAATLLSIFCHFLFVILAGPFLLISAFLFADVGGVGFKILDVDIFLSP